MEGLSNPSVVKDILERFSLAPNKALGQNFLCDGNIVSRIADAAGIDGEDAVLEIGPGLGALTVQLAKRAKKVVAVEVDSGLIKALAYTLSDCGNVEVVHGDFLKCDLSELHQKLGGGGFKVAANLPYYITTPIVMALLESGLPVESMSFLVQKEVAERMAARPSTKHYGSLSIAVQFETDASIALAVPRGCFVPAPNVDSVVVRLVKTAPKAQVKSREDFFALTRCAFAMRRKTLANNLAAGLGMEKDAAAELISRAGLSESIRGEAMSIKEFARLSDLYTEKKQKGRNR